MRRRSPAMPLGRLPVVDGDLAQVALTQGQVAIIDACDVALVGDRCWHAHWDPKTQRFYAMANMRPERGTILLHRLIMQPAADLVVDHVDHNTLDNRRRNLRVGTHRQNQRNRLAASAASGYLGVYLMKGGRRRPWTAKTQIAGRSHHIGYFADASEAARARDEWIREKHPSEFWTFNFPRPNERGIQRSGESA